MSTLTVFYQVETWGLMCSYFSVGGVGNNITFYSLGGADVGLLADIWQGVCPGVSRRRSLQRHVIRLPEVDVPVDWLINSSTVERLRL